MSFQQSVLDRPGNRERHSCQGGICWHGWFKPGHLIHQQPGPCWVSHCGYSREQALLGSYKHRRGQSAFTEKKNPTYILLLLFQFINLAIISADWARWSRWHQPHHHREWPVPSLGCGCLWQLPVLYRPGLWGHRACGQVHRSQQGRAARQRVRPQSPQSAPQGEWVQSVSILFCCWLFLWFSSWVSYTVLSANTASAGTANGCTNNVGVCEQLCLPRPLGLFSCACATGFKLNADNRTCDHYQSYVVISTLSAIKGFSLEGSDHSEAMVPVAGRGWLLYICQSVINLLFGCSQWSITQ